MVQRHVEAQRENTAFKTVRMIERHTTGPKIISRLFQVAHKGKGRNYAYGHVSTFHEMIFVEYGGLDLAVEGKAYPLRGGDCIFIPAESRHALRGAHNAPVSFLNVNYYGYLPRELANRPFTPSTDALNLLNRIKRVATTEPVTPTLAELAACLVTELILLLCCERSISLRTDDPEPSNRRRYRSDVVHKALNLIAEQYTDDLSAARVAEFAGTSVSNLRRLLNAETGHGFRAHLHMARIEAAKHLLLDSSDNVSAIAEHVGYNSIPAFHRVFRRLTGRTPMQYARNPDAPATRVDP